MKYQLLDSGGKQKLERIGEFVLVRPCSQAIWRPLLPLTDWKKADAIFTRDPVNQWIGLSSLPPTWVMEHQGVCFKLMPTDFGHVGIFPEHAVLWTWMRAYLSAQSSLLNLFAYTGGATLAAAQAGAQVCHVDASKASVAWARENCHLNGLDKARIRWIVDDVLKFLKREVRRDHGYDGIILDPPTFGRGSKGEVFKIEKDLPDILSLCFQLLSKKFAFIMLSSHTPGYTPLVLRHLLHQASSRREGVLEMGEMTIPGPLDLASGAYAIWHSGERDLK